jgi:hypothetical protein
MRAQRTKSPFALSVLRLCCATLSRNSITNDFESKAH